MHGRVAVFGLGYVGLPLAGACVDAGMDVIGFDICVDTVTQLQSGVSHIDDISSSQLSLWLDHGLKFVHSLGEIRDVDVLIICVPTPLTDAGEPDLSAVEAASESISGLLSFCRGMPLVILESTTYPGTTDEVVRPILERSGKIAGRDFHLAYSPERVDPGNEVYTMQNTIKLVSGLTAECAVEAERFYREIVDEVFVVSGLREAEMAKLLENTYRHVNIALINEFAKICNLLNIDVWNVIEAAATKPYGYQAFHPGPGVGGHCIPIDPKYLTHKVAAELGYGFSFIELASEVNSSMPLYVVERLQDLLDANNKELRGSKVVIMGVTYKADIADMRETPALPVVRHLLRHEAQVVFADPFVNAWIVDDQEIERTSDLVREAAQADAVVLLQGHSAFLQDLNHLQCSVLLDTRGITAKGSHWTRL